MVHSSSSHRHQAGTGALVIESTGTGLAERLHALRITPTFIACYVSPFLDIDEIATILSRRFPDTAKSICSTAGELHSCPEKLYCTTGQYWDRVVLHLFDASIIAQAEVVSLPLGCDDLRQGRIDIRIEERISHLKQKIESLEVEMEIDHRDTLAYITFDGLSRSESFFLEALYESGRFPCLFVGGSAGGKPDFRNTWLHDGQNVLENHVLISFLKMAPDIRFGIMKSQNFSPTGQSYTILSASVEHRYVNQVIDEDGHIMGIIDALCSTFGCSPFDLQRQLENYSFAIRIGDELFIRSVSTIDIERDLMHFYCDLAPGEQLLLVKRGNLVENTGKDLHQFMRGKPGAPVAAILNDCILRRVFNQEYHSDMRSVFSGSAIAGFSTFGETLGLYLNQTLTGIFFFHVAPGTQFTDDYVDNFITRYSDFRAFYLKRKLAKLEGLAGIVVNQIDDFKKHRYTNRLKTNVIDSTMVSVFEGLNDLGQALEKAEAQRLLATSEIEERLLESEERFRLLSDSSLAGVYLIQDNRFTYVNSAFAQMFGYEVHEILHGLLFIDLVAPQDRPLVAENIQRRLAGEEQSIRYAFRGLRKNQSTFHLEVHGRRIIIQGKVGIIGTFIDITEQKKAEEDLRASERNYRALYNETPSMFFTVNGEGSISAVNDFAADRLGYLKDELLATQYAEVVHEDHRTAVRTDLAACFGHPEKVATWQCRKRCRNGDLMWCEEFARSVTDLEGNANILIVSQDITERKHLEESLKVSQFIFDQASISIFLIRGDSEIIDVNAHACHSLGYTREELCSLSIPDIAPALDREQLAALRQKLNTSRSETLQTQHRRKNGETFPVQVFTSALFLEGSPLRVSFAQDISDMEKARIEQEALKTQLEQVQKLEAIGRLAGGVAHDLNNLLTPILGYAGILGNDPTLPEKAGQKVAYIRKAAIGARDLIRQLLAFSRKQVLEYRQLDLNELVQEFSVLLHKTIRENIALTLTLSPDVMPIVADQGQLEQVLMNLVVNAADAMPDGGKIAIATSLAELDETYTTLHPGVNQGQYALLSISDTGSGIDKETMGKIFEPFFSTKGELGTGLGLATVYGIVKQHKGTIWVYSEPGIGTTFKIFLPAGGEGAANIREDSASQADIRGTETILLVEDNDAVRSTVKDILTQNGYDVIDCPHGQSALEKASAITGIDLLLTDVIMPGMNGRELYENLAGNRPCLKVLYMSGYMDDIIVHHGVLHEGIQFIQKPFTAEAILGKVRKVLDA